MRPPAPRTPMRRVSLAPRTRVEARAVSPLAMIKLRRLSWCGMASILAGRGGGEKRGKLLAENVHPRQAEKNGGNARGRDPSRKYPPERKNPRCQKRDRATPLGD